MSRSTVEVQEPSVDQACGADVHFKQDVFEHQKQEASRTYDVLQKPEKAVALSGFLSASSATSMTHDVPSVEEPLIRDLYVTDEANEGVAPCTRSCISIFSKLKPLWRRRGALKSSTLDQSKGREPNSHSETELSRTSNHVESEIGNLERFIAADTLPSNFAESASLPLDENTWEEFDSSNRRDWFQSCKVWPPHNNSNRRPLVTPKQISVPGLRPSLQESVGKSTQSLDLSFDSGLESIAHSHAASFVVKEELPTTTADEVQLVVLRKTSLSSHSRSHRSSSSDEISHISQASSLFVIQKHDYELASQDRLVPAVVSTPSYDSREFESDDDSAFILQVGLD